ncbi:hypothetical protein FQN57_001717 [Myotisia sp. PD_48]|nr:hypothetical protein FQN57_001717 [Myotisia sp. PD_48]
MLASQARVGNDTMPSMRCIASWQWVLHQSLPFCRRGSAHMESSSILLEAIQKAVKDCKLCSNRIWEVGSWFEQWKVKLSGILLQYCSTFKNSLEHRDHSMCTFGFCKYSSRNFTAVKQRHELMSCKDFCFRPRRRFREQKLLEALNSNRQLTAWTLDGLSMIKHPQLFMAISHVWSDGTGNGAWPPGEVNECLYSYLRSVAEQFQCEGIWWDTVCIPQHDRVAPNFMHANYEYAMITLVHNFFLRKLACLQNFTKDLNEDILKKVKDGNIAAKAIKNLRKPITDIDELLATLGPNHTSWLKNQANIAGLLAGVDLPSDPSDTFKRDISKHPAKMGRIRHSHLFHKSATMSGGFIESMAINMTIGDTEGWNQLEGNKNAWNVLEENKKELESTVSSEKKRNGQSLETQIFFLGNDSWTALHHAVWKCNLTMVKQFGKSKIDFGISDELGSRPLHLVAERRNDVLVKFLLDNGKSSGKELIHIRDQLGRTALDYAAERGSENMVRSLLANGADPNVQCYSNGQTALHRAIWRGSKKVVQVSLDGSNSKKSDAGVKDNDGRTALYYAAEQGNKAIVDELTSHKMPLSIDKQAGIAAEDDGGRTVLYWAGKKWNKEICQLLINEGADKMVIDKGGQTTLHWVAKGGNEAMV